MEELLKTLNENANELWLSN